MTRCFAGYFIHNSLIALTTTTLNSSPISPMKVEICFISLSTLPSLPVLSKVVIANVAIDLLLSDTNDSMSSLHLATLTGCLTATSLSVLIAANLKEGLGDETNSSCCFINNHFVLMSQTILQELISSLRISGIQ